jgi:hypothetical protein
LSTYIAGRATNLGVGEQLTLVSATLGAAPYTTPAVAIGRDGSGFDLATVHNASNQTATVQVSATDVDAGFLPLTDPDTGDAVTIAAATAGTFQCIGPFARLSFAADPAASGAVILSR